MKKFVLTETGEEVKLGSVIKVSGRVTYSFGVMETTDIITITKFNIDDLIEKGIIKCISVDKIKASTPKEDTVWFYIESLARRYKYKEEALIKWLNDTNKICAKAVLDILLKEISLHFYYKNPRAFDDAENYYSLRLRDGKVGKVQSVNSYIPLFKSAEDAEKARVILKKQLEFMYGEQKDN